MPSPTPRTSLSSRLRQGLCAAGLMLLMTGWSLPAQAARPAGAFAAQLATPLGEARRELLGEQVWRCSGDNCTTRFDGAHPLRTCARAAQTFGPMVRFSSPGGELSPEQLTRCNAAAGARNGQ